MKGEKFVLAPGSGMQGVTGRLGGQKLGAAGHVFTTTMESVTKAHILTVVTSLPSWTVTRNCEPNTLLLRSLSSERFITRNGKCH